MQALTYTYICAKIHIPPTHTYIDTSMVLPTVSQMICDFLRSCYDFVASFIHDCPVLIFVIITIEFVIICVIVIVVCSVGTQVHR